MKANERLVFKRLVKFVEEAQSHPRGVSGVLEDIERRRGAVIVPLGATVPFRFDPVDWKRGVISVLGAEARIVAIEANAPRKGALRRLITAIEDAGMTPTILAPMFNMPAILEHWKWIRYVEPDEEGGTYEIWRPS